MVKVLIKKLNSLAKLPSYKTDGASGMDLMACIEKPINLEPGKSCLIPTMYTLGLFCGTPWSRVFTIL